jgi:hypothetical protein
VERYHERVVITVGAARRRSSSAQRMSARWRRPIAVLSESDMMKRFQEAEAAIADGDVTDGDQLRSIVGLPLLGG